MKETDPVLLAWKKTQLETRIRELKLLIKQYNEKIDYYYSQMKNADKSYNSITHFKGVVQCSAENFSGANNAKSSALEQVNSVSVNNIVAQEYYSGMKKIVSGTGARITQKLYQFLTVKIRDEQKLLWRKFQDSSDKIKYYTALLNNAKAEYTAKVNELQSL